MHPSAPRSFRRPLCVLSALGAASLLLSLILISCNENASTGSEREGSDLPLGTVRALIGGVEYKTDLAQVWYAVRGDSITRYYIQVSYGEAVIGGVAQEQVHMFIMLPDTSVGAHDANFSESEALPAWPYSRHDNLHLIPRGQRYNVQLGGYAHEFWAAGPTPGLSGFASKVTIRQWDPRTKEVSGTFEGTLRDIRDSTQTLEIKEGVFHSALTLTR